MTNPPDDKIREILENARTIAVVGHSDKPHRTSYQIAQYLRDAGYQVYPVNPTVDSINGHKSYPSVAAIPDEIDVVDVFRRSKFLNGIADDAIEAGAKVLWGQLGVEDWEAGEKAAEAGLDVVMDRCMKIEHRRLVR